VKGKLPGLVVNAENSVCVMVLRLEFDSRVHLKTGTIRPLDGRKMKIIKTAKRGKSHQKIFKKVFYVKKIQSIN
jgi:hypothetical protein